MNDRPGPGAPYPPKGVKRMSRLGKALSWRYRRFVQRQGYVVMTVVCAAVIAGSAAWTQQSGFRHVEAGPTPDAASVAELWQQSLQSAATPSPAPTDGPSLWRSPLAALAVLTPYAPDRLIPSGIAGLWQAHDAVDLAADPGEPVAAIRDGTVMEVTDTAITLRHEDGWVSEYAGLATTGDMREGQPVRAGDIIGVAGGSAHGRSCLHLRVTRDRQSADPLALFAEP